MRSFKSLLIPAVIMVLLVIGVIVYFIVSGSSGTGKTEPTGQAEAFYVKAEQLKSLSVEAKDPSRSAIKISMEPGSDGNVQYTYDGQDKDPKTTYSSDKMKECVSMLSSLYGTLISSDMSLSEYGLAEPDYKVTYEFNNGEIHTAGFGILSPDGKSVYINVDGKQEVYAVDSERATYADYTVQDLMETKVMDLDFAELATVRFQRTSDNFDITCEAKYNAETEESSYHVIKPYNIDASSYFTTLVSNIAKLEVASFIDIDSGELASYGLDKPSFIITFTMNSGSSKKLCLSSNLAGFYYGYIEGTSDYFKISDSQIKLLEAPYLSLLEAYIAYYNVSDLSSIKGNYKDEQFVFSLDVDDNEAISDDGTYVELDGRNAKIFNSEGRSYCAMFFESLVCMEIGGIDMDAEPSYGDPLCSFTFVGKDYQTKTVEFITRTNDSYFVFVNGEYSGFYVFDKVLFNNGGQDTYSYGVWEAYKLLNTAISENINGVYDIPS